MKIGMAGTGKMGTAIGERLIAMGDPPDDADSRESTCLPTKGSRAIASFLPQSSE